MVKHMVRLMVIMAACLLVTAAAYAAGERYVLSQGDFSTIIEPISYSRTVGQFYVYGSGNTPGVPANTGYEKKRAAILFLYRDTKRDQLHLVMIHSVRGGYGGKAWYKFYGIPEGADWTKTDDTEGYFNYDYYAHPPTEARWLWYGYYTDGGAIGDISGFDEITVEPDFKSGITKWIVVTGDVNNPEYIYLDSLEMPVVISQAEIPVSLDIKPGSCPNPINTRSNGVISVSVNGSAEFDVTQVDPDTVTLSGVAPLRVTMADVATPYEPYLGKEQPYDCISYGPDGIADLVFKFDTAEVVRVMQDSLGSLEDREAVVLSLTGQLYDEYGGLTVRGEDVVIILKKGRSR